MKLLTFIILLFSSVQAKRVDFWLTIPFIKVADLCNYQDTFGQSRSEYMNQMVGLAQELMTYGAYGSEALQMLASFQSLYERNVALATQGRYLDVTLESTFRAYIDQYYRDLKPRMKNISFRHIAPLVQIVNAINNNQRVGTTSYDLLEDLDYMLYGSYSFAPNCRGDILVTLTLLSSDGRTKNYMGQGKPSVVMSQIASKIFQDFQRTQFPSTISMGARSLTIIGDLNSQIGDVHDSRVAQVNCDILGARLPTVQEYQVINSYGSWSGGVSLGNKTNKWCLQDRRYFTPNSTRTTWGYSDINDKSCKYICVQ